LKKGTRKERPKEAVAEAGKEPTQETKKKKK